MNAKERANTPIVPLRSNGGGPHLVVDYDNNKNNYRITLTVITVIPNASVLEVRQFWSTPKTGHCPGLAPLFLDSTTRAVRRDPQARKVQLDGFPPARLSDTEQNGPTLDPQHDAPLRRGDAAE